MPWLHFYEKNFTKNRDSTVYAWSGSYPKRTLGSPHNIILKKDTLYIIL